VISHIPRGSALLVDDNHWTDLVRGGFDPNPIWFYKLDLDPSIRAKYKNGWRDVDYIVLEGAHSVDPARPPAGGSGDPALGGRGQLR
jgi:hypothetical protein